MFYKNLVKTYKQTHLVFVLGIFGEKNTKFQFIFDLYIATHYCTSYLIKIDKTITMELKAITNNYNENTIEATHSHSKKGNISLYHASRTFRFFNTFPLKERAFVC